MGYRLGRRSKQRLKGVHPDLVRVVKRAIEITEVDFAVLEGMRTLERQRELFNKGASKTMNSRHLTGHAVDLGAWVDGTISWDWPHYHKIADAMKKAAKQITVESDTVSGVPLVKNVAISWGGDWDGFPDGPHFQLSWKEYPKDAS